MEFLSWKKDKNPQRKATISFQNLFKPSNTDEQDNPPQKWDTIPLCKTVVVQSFATHTSLLTL